MFKKIKRILSMFVMVFLTILLISCSSGITNTTKNYTWYDANGAILHSIDVDDNNTPSFALPKDNDKWEYIKWEWTGTYERTAVRQPKYTYFVGNVFQIIVYNLEKRIIGTGSGFVFNKQGWFVTNYHVMEDGYFAEAIFDLPDNEKGESFTKLDINLTSYFHRDKDVFIGKLENYNKIGNSNYKQIDFNKNYDIGDKTYSVGYPSSSIVLKINEGYIQSELSSIYDKVYSGVTYIGSTSYIAPGSSGGILVNDNLEVLGMTTIGITDGRGNFKLGGAIEVFNYKNQIDSTKESDLKEYILSMHPEEKGFIKIYLDAMRSTKTVKSEVDGKVRYTYTWTEEGENQSGFAFSVTKKLNIDSDGLIEYKINRFWAGGDKLETRLFGNFSETEGIKNFKYEFEYKWSSGISYWMYSTNINYSDNLELTLQDYVSVPSWGYTITEENFEYGKMQFNYIYWELRDLLSAYN